MQNEKVKIEIKNSKLDIKKRSYLFALKIISVVDSLSNNRSNLIIGDQLLGSGTSIGANIIEAQAAGSRRDFSNFLNHALKSANETRFWLGLLRDSGKVSTEEITPLLTEAQELAHILASSVIKLRSNI